jgi:phosphohistidine phosphatase
LLVYILRHGEASHEALNDRGRPLSDDGKLSITRVAKYLADEKILLAKIITSPLLRAWQTAQIIGDSFKVNESIQESEYLLPESNPVDIIMELKSFRDDEKILLISHHPFLSLLISKLTGNLTNKIEMRTSSLACVEIRQPAVEGKGVLKFIMHFLG